MEHHPNQHSRARERGSILVTCLVLATVGTLGVAAWISLMDARSNLAEANFTALQRRVIEGNSKALAYLAVYENHNWSNAPTTSVSEYAIDGDLGQCIVMPYTAAPLTDSSNTRVSKNGSTPLRSYSTDIEVRTYKDAASMKGTEFDSWSFQLRSYNPVLGGELLSVAPPTPANDGNPLVSGSLHVKGRAVFWDAVTKDFNAGLRANEYVLPNRIGSATTLLTPGGGTTLPLNYPIPVQTSGFDGTNARLNVFDPDPNNYHNAYFQRMTGQIDIDMSVPSSDSPGPDTAADGVNDAALEIQIQNQTPATLVNSLVPYYPLSSRVLRAVVQKNNPAFNGSQLKQVFNSHIPIPDDALQSLMAVHGTLHPEDLETLNFDNNTRYVAPGNGNIWIYLDQPNLSHLFLRAPQNVFLVGQNTTAKGNAAASLPPISVIATRTAGDPAFSSATLRHANRRKLIFGIATRSDTSPQTSFTNLAFTGSLPFPTWTMILESRSTPLTYSLGSVAGATIRGGIRTNTRMQITGGTLTLEPETGYTGLEDSLVRTTWIEAYRN